MYNMGVLTLNSFFNVVDQGKLLIACTVALGLMYGWYVLTILGQIKRHLGIYALHLGKMEKSEFIVCFRITGCIDFCA